MVASLLEKHSTFNGQHSTPNKVRDREAAITSTRDACAPQNYAFARPERATNFRRTYKTDAMMRTIVASRKPARVSAPTELSLNDACPRIQRIAAMASMGTIFIPGKLNPDPSVFMWMSRCTRNQQAAQQSRYINSTATLERTASCSKVPVMDKAKAITAYVTMATSGER